jgi:hypothetical protein
VESILKAIYETKRQGLILAKKNPATANAIDDATAYAYKNRMKPLFGSDTENDPFESVYEIKTELTDAVTKHIDSVWDKGPIPSFRELEDKFGGYRTNRSELISILRYTFLSDRFDDKTYKTILADAPIEAQGINRPFSDNEIYL